MPHLPDERGGRRKKPNRKQGRTFGGKRAAPFDGRKGARKKKR